MVIHKLQLIAIGFTAVFFALGWSGFAGISAVYGGLISIANSVLWTRHTAQQKHKLASNAKASLGMMVRSVVIRMGVVALLVWVGLVLWQLYPAGVLGGLAVGQFGFILDLLLERGRHGIR